MTLSVALENIQQQLNPSLAFHNKGWIGDIFSRDSLTPTGFPTIYTEANNGGGSGAMSASTAAYVLTTSAGGAGEDVSLRCSGFRLVRDNTLNGAIVRNMNGQVLDYYTAFFCGDTTATEGFVGLMGNNASALTALPTTASHMGVFWDRSADTNFIISSSNNSAQVTTDTTIAQATTYLILHIRWNGVNSATIELLNSSTLARVGTAQTVTALGSIGTMTPHWFIQTEGAAAKTLSIRYWMARLT